MKKMADYINYCTLDVDSTDKELINRIIAKIMKCEFIVDFNFEPSKQKGYHFRLYCSRKCDMCRLVFDDEIRFAFDQYRQQYSRDVLTQETYPFKITKRE